MKLTWQKFGWVEVQVWEPETPASSAILFCPGFPGMGATIFEQRHAAALTDHGFAVYVIKHKGTNLYGPTAPAMVNNAARLMTGRKNGDTHLGGGPAILDEWMMEPVSLLKALSEKYDDIRVFGNSFGALSALWSLTETGLNIDNVQSVVLYAGAQGVAHDSADSIMRLWKADYMTLPRITDKVTLNAPAEMIELLNHVYKLLPERVMALPQKIKMTCVVVEKDEILSLYDSERFNRAIGGRAKIVVDTIDHAWPEHGLLAHDTPNFKTEDLLQLI